MRAILGMDEQTPGSKVNHDNRRKNMVICFNFLELGHDVLVVEAPFQLRALLRLQRQDVRLLQQSRKRERGD